MAKTDLGALGKKPVSSVAPFGKTNLGVLSKKPGSSITAFKKMDLTKLRKAGKLNMGAFGKKPAPGMDLGDKDDHGILEGISSLHSWIKSQTMMKPTAKARGRMEPEEVKCDSYFHSKQLMYKFKTFAQYLFQFFFSFSRIWMWRW